MILKEIYKFGELNLFSKYRENAVNLHRLEDLFWEATLTCNAKCKHCGSSAETKEYKDELSTEEIKNALKQAADNYDASKILINVTGGEPLVRKDLFEVMDYATNTLGFHWGMTTNGILIDDAVIDNMKKSKMETISVSVDGIGKTHDEFRGVDGSYEIILNNIRNLKTADFLTHLQVSTVFHKSNINQLEELYTTMLDLQLDSWRLMSMDPIGRAKNNENLLLDGDELKKILDFILENNKNKKLKLKYGCSGFLGLKYEKDARGHYFFCRTGINVASILYNGDLFVCPNVERRKELIQGNVKVDNFKDIWENKYKEFRYKYRTSCISCKKCSFWDYCLGGAYHLWNFDENIPNHCTYKLINEK